MSEIPPLSVLARGCPDPEEITAFVGLTFRQVFLTQVFFWDCSVWPRGGGTPSTLRVLQVIISCAVALLQPPLREDPPASRS